MKFNYSFFRNVTIFLILEKLLLFFTNYPNIASNACFYILLLIIKRESWLNSFLKAVSIVANLLHNRTHK